MVFYEFAGDIEIMDERGFTKKHSLILKGIMVVFLLFHHVFYGDNVATHGIILSGINENTFSILVIYGKLCLSGFAFISAYGIAKKLKVCEGIQEYFGVCISRLIKLSASCLFVYFVAVIYKRLVVVQSIRDVYKDVNGVFHPVYMIIDALGCADLFGTPLINVTWWYFSYAILLICSMPAIYIVYKRVRFFAVPMSLFLFPGKMIGIAVLGTMFAYEGLFTKIQNKISQNDNLKVKSGVFLVCCGLIYISYCIVASTGKTSFVMDWSGVVYAIVVMLYISKIPFFSNILCFVGKHSATMFMTHTFIYMYFYSDFIYSFRRDYVIYGVLFACSLVVAIIIDSAQKIIHYDKMIAKLNLESVFR